MVLKFVINDSDIAWDGARSKAMKKKALPGLYANTAETDEVEWTLQSHEQQDRSKILKLAKQPFSTLDGESLKASGLRYK